MKRLLDIVLSAAALIAFSPLLLACAAAVVLSSEGGAFFTQERVGLGGRPFKMYKFRSMVKDASTIGPYFTATSNDPRITRVGAILRRTSLDELPQLLNVLKGDMSIVGPRPDVFLQRSIYTEEEWNLRNSVRPGITGLAQARHRSAATLEERKALDLEYARRASVLLDIWIILLTIKTVVSGRGGN